MPNPKRRHSSSRRGKRRAHDSLAVPSLSTCSNCGSPVQAHRVCQNCGYYKGKKVVELGES